MGTPDELRSAHADDHRRAWPSCSIGLLGTFGGVIPEIGGLSSRRLGAWSFVVAAIVLVLGMIFEGI